MAPNTFTPTATSTTKSITVTASTTDAAAANGSGSSGIAGYRFSKDNGSTWTAYQNKGEYTWDKLQQTTNYTIKVEAKDNAGNVRQGSVSKGTGTVETATGGTYSPTTWTNGNVKVTLPTKSGFTTRYTIDGTKPTKDSTQYTGEFTVSSNCTIIYLYTDGTNIGGTGTLSVTNIDKLAPNTFTPTATSTTKSITVTASTTDAAAANGSGSSGIAGYRFSKDNGNTWTAYQTSGTYTWDNLPQTTNYTIKVEAKDNAGNVRQGSVSKGTGTVETATGGTYNPTTWTNGNVKVTLPTKSGFTTRYTIDGTKPTKDSTQYTGQFTVSSNCTITYVYTDGVNIGGTGTLSVTNIDKLAPNTFTPTATSTTKSITVTASTTDAAAANGSGSSGIAGYRFSKDNGSTWTAYQNKGEYTWDKLPQTTNYTIKVEAKDNAGNVRQGSVSKGTGTVETATGGTYSPTTWTNGNVTVTLPTKSGFTTRYTTNGVVPTKDSTQYTGEFTVSSNCTITYLYTDGTNIGGTGSLSVTNIDKTQPVVTETTATTNKITIKAKDDESGIVGYAITTSNTEPSNFTSVTNTKSLDTSLTGYKQSTTYYVWVKDAVGNISTSKSTATTKVTDLTVANTTFSYNPSSWTNGNVIATASTTVTGFTLQTSKDRTNWSSTATQELTNNSEKIYARLWDGTNGGSYATGNATNIDKLAPNIFTPTLTYTELKDASDTIKQEYNYKGIFTDGTGMDKYFAYNNTNAGEIYYFAGNYYLCIKSALAGYGSTLTSIEYFKVIGSSYKVGLTISTDVTDAEKTSTNGQSGIKEYYFGKIKDDQNEWEWTDAKNTSSYSFSDLVPDSTYQFRIKVIDNAGNERESGGATGAIKGKLTQTVTTDQVVASPTVYYGKTVTDHKSTNGWSGWKIFYAQGTYVYLIADDYVPNHLINDNTGMELNDNYQARWETSNPPAMQNVGSSRTIFKGTGYTLNQNYPNSKCASTLLRTSNWSNFLSSNKSGLAIGGPTIEMWMASWNQIYPNDKLYCNSTNTYGYRVGTSSTPSTEYIDYNVMNKKEGYKNKLYYPHNISSAWNGVYTYWTCSTSAFVYKDDGTSGERLINIDNRGYVGSDPYYFYSAGIRPVVRMKSGVSMEIIK